MNLRRRLLLLLPALLCVLAALGFGRPVSAHNSLQSSDPADGATLDAAPAAITMTFANAVPLDTASAELIDATGVRTDLAGLAHGPGGDTEVVAPLPALGAGEVTVRWRLVGADGHPITGRIAFTVTTAGATAATTTTVPSAAVASAPATTLAGAAPVWAEPADPSTGGVAGTSDESASGFAEPWSMPDAARWVFRMLSYVAIVAVAGVIATSVLVWPRAWAHPVIRQVVAYSLLATGVLAIVQLAVVASDIDGSSPWSALGSLGPAFETDAGRAFGVRVLAIGAVAAALFAYRPPTDSARWIAAGAGTLVALGTWAFAGHSRSMRWPLIGVPLDVAHHAAAAAWLGALAIVGIVSIRETSTGEMVGVVQRFARMAPPAVAVIVGTGLVQALRLVGSPTRLFAADHGRYLVAKLVLLGVMLKVADMNRQRVNRRFQSTARASAGAAAALRRAMGTEFAVGLAVIGITSAMVVSPPAVALDDETATRPTTSAPEQVVVATTLAALLVPVSSAAEPAATEGTCTIDDTLQAGASGDAVSCLQTALMAVDLFDGPPTGDFDEITDSAVREYQATEALVVDGIVGPATATQLGIWGG